MTPVTEGQFTFNVDTFYVTTSGGQVHRRAAPPEIKAQYDTGIDSTPDHPGHWYEAQLIHYGLPPSKVKATAKMRLLKALQDRGLSVPKEILETEKNLKKAWKKQDSEQPSTGEQQKSSTKTVRTKTVITKTTTTSESVSKTTATAKAAATKGATQKATAKTTKAKAVATKAAANKAAAPAKAPAAAKSTPKPAPKKKATKTPAAPKGTGKATPVKKAVAKNSAALKSTAKEATTAKRPAPKKATGPKASTATATAAKAATAAKPKTQPTKRKRESSNDSTTNQPQTAKRPANGDIKAQNATYDSDNSDHQSREWGEPGYHDGSEDAYEGGYGNNSEYDDAPPPYEMLYGMGYQHAHDSYSSDGAGRAGNSSSEEEDDSSDSY